MSRFKRIISVLLAAAVLFSLATAVFALSDKTVDSALEDTAAYIQKTVTNPTVTSIGGEWSIIGLARSGCSVPASYYEKYYNNLEEYVKQCGGILHQRKYTEYSRVILALTAIGKDPSDVAGYNLLTPLGDYNKTVWQGINGGIFALIALDSGNYPMPENKDAEIQATREMYVDFILDRELDSGGWALTGTQADADITAMALQALAKYTDRNDVKTSVDRAVAKLSELQNSEGGYSSWGTVNCESSAQVIVALTELGVSVTDSRFVKNGKSVVDSLMSYYTQGSGFTHVQSGGSGVDLMSTEQAMYALAAVKRSLEGKNTLYDMTDVTPASFPDVAGHRNQQAIDALVKKEIINGLGNGTFGPEKSMTRAQFCTITVKALELETKYNASFTDVPAGKWYSNFIGAAYEAGIVNGIGGGLFRPDGTITRQQAATMTVRAAKICGIDTSMTQTETDAVLSGLSDGASVSDYARSAVAFCYKSGITDRNDSAWSSVRPNDAILRCEVAQMIYNMLSAAGRL